ncbi:esterase/lipase family protein [Corynebacterium pelargi]|uniref:Lipase n=1 Tax=Corynebacterium pelargi TaxID=1471400 RepID=A0A410W5W9_9CORY|nr:triacylglycerol lipase [Corynebacterium pelargi]QAU51355.1 Lipase precursor [Corynebacterium pelargi]GGG81509.1 acetyltransferase [Corynebacterium pelargi]
MPKEIMNHTLPISARLPARGLFEDDWRARPSKQHPYPVILIHGTGVTKGDWMELGQDLREEGYAVFAPDFGFRSTVLVEESTEQVAAYIHAVLTVCEAKKVILVGHSQGGIIARYWMHHLGGARHTHHLISLAAPHHGTLHGGVMNPLSKTKRGSEVMDSLISGFFGQSGFQMLKDSELIQALNAKGETLEGVHYSCIATRTDSIIQPVESGFLDGARNIYLQQVDRNAIVRHEDLPYDPRSRQLVLAEITRLEHTPWQAHHQH